MAKCYEDLRFTDDFMFGKVMENKALCRDVLACLLGHAVGELHDVQTERQFRCTLDGKPIRLDVYARDADTVYDAEMQNLNHSSVQSLALPKRSRFYQSLMDNDFLEKGNSYRSLPEGRVLFLCTFDPFGQGLPQYIFENRCEGHPALTLRDGALKIFYNCTCLSEALPTELRALYSFVRTGAGSTALTERLAAAVDAARRNEKWRSEYMKELLHDDDIRTDARAEGISLGKAEGIAAGIRGFILDKLEDGADQAAIVQRLQKVYSLSKEEAENYFRLSIPG